MQDNAVWTEWNALIHCRFKLMQDVRFERQNVFKPSWSERVVMKFMIHLITLTNRDKTHRFAPLHLEGETCWRDLIQLPSHSVGEAMQEGLMMEGSFGWVVFGDHKALLTGWFGSPHARVVDRTAVLFWTHLERIHAEYNPHNLNHQSLWKQWHLYLPKSRQKRKKKSSSRASRAAASAQCECAPVGPVGFWVEQSLALSNYNPGFSCESVRLQSYNLWYEIIREAQMHFG